MQTIEPIYAPMWSPQEESYTPTDELVGYELWSSSGEVIARAETREELLCYVYLDEGLQSTNRDSVKG